MHPAASPRPILRASTRRRLLAGVALASVAAACPALAQTVTPQPGSEAIVTAPRGPVGPDGLAEEGLYLQAGEITEDQEAGALTARGDVEARYEGRTLRAQEIVYHTETGLVTARGEAQIINPDGTVQYADEIELDDELRAGVATGFAARQEGGIKVAAATAVRRSEDVNELNRAIFTPCEICDDEGNPKQPTWSIQAEKVIQDRERRLVYYRDAVIRVKGVPVFYTPVLWHPDPSAERASGLLMPEVSLSDRRGLSWEQPYLWAISPYQDLVISPQINEKVNPFLNLEWRKRFYSGTLEARLGYTYERNFGDVQGEDNVKFGDETSRSYILAGGEFQIDDAWRWGFAVERVTDPTLFDRYDIGDVYEQRGLFSNERRRLLSQLYAVRHSERSYISVSALSFQSLRFTRFDNVDPSTLPVPQRESFPFVFEDDGVFPFIGPLIEARWEPLEEIGGGRLRLEASAVVLTRDRYVGAPVLRPPYIAGPGDALRGVDSRRVSVGADWRRALTTRGGVRVEPFLEARGDLYSVSQLPGAEGDETLARAHATAGVDVRYPLVRRLAGGAVLTLEPMAQLAVSPQADLDARIPNEDSLTFEFDETNLFEVDRFPGYDLYEGGARLSLGGRGVIDWGGGRNAMLFVGRSFRAEEEPGFLRPVGNDPSRLYDPTGLADTESDWIVAARASPMAGVATWGRVRFDSDTWEVRQAEASVNFTLGPRADGYFRYLVNRTDPNTVTTPGLDPTNPQVLTTNYNYLQGGGQLLVTENWGVTFNATRDLNDDIWRRSEIGLLYQDDCIRVEVLYERDETYLGSIGASEGVFVRLNLATLGDAGYRRRDDRW